MTETKRILNALASGKAQLKRIQGQTIVVLKPQGGQPKRNVKITTARTYGTSTKAITVKKIAVKKPRATKIAKAKQLYQSRYDKALHAARKLPVEVREQYAKTKMAAYGAHKASMVSVKKTMLAYTKGPENTLYHLKNIENWLKDNVGGTARNTLSANIGEWIDRGDLAGTEQIQNVVDRLNSDKEISNSDFKEIRQLIYAVATGTMSQGEAEVKLAKLVA